MTEPAPTAAASSRPWFPWPLYALVVVAALIGWSKADEPGTAHRLGFSLGTAAIQSGVTVAAYRLSKKTWVAALVGFLWLGIMAPSSARFDDATDAVAAESRRLMATTTLAQDELIAAGAADWSTMSSAEAIEERLLLARKARDAQLAIVSWCDGGPDLQALLTRRGMSRADRDRWTLGYRRSTKASRALFEAQSEVLSRLVDLIELLQQERGHWEVDAEGTLQFDHAVADESVQKANELLTAFAAADQRRGEELAKLAKR